MFFTIKLRISVANDGRLVGSWQCWVCVRGFEGVGVNLAASNPLIQTQHYEVFHHFTKANSYLVFICETKKRSLMKHTLDVPSCLFPKAILILYGGLALSQSNNCIHSQCGNVMKKGERGGKKEEKKGREKEREKRFKRNKKHNL